MPDKMRPYPRQHRNPKIGSHPDLFGGKTALWKPLSELTEAQLRKLPRSAFWNDEFDDLDEDTQEWIHDHDPDSKDRVRGLVDVFVDRYRWTQEPTSYSMEDVEAEQDYWLGQLDDNEMLERASDYAKRWLDLTYKEWKDAGASDEQIDAAVLEAFRDINNYSYDFVYGSATGMFSTEMQGSIYVDQDEIRAALAGMHPDEIRVALDEIRDETDDVVDLSERELRETRYGYELHDISTGIFFSMSPDLDSVENEIRDILSEEEFVPEHAATPPEDRVVYRFDDDSFVLNLDAAELPDESRALGHCVGDPRHGYVAAVLRKEAAIWSLRTAAGKPKLTIELEIDGYGKPVMVHQVRGKSNRYPGWAAGPPGKSKFKPDEVNKVIEVLEAYGLDPDVQEMRVAIDHMRGIGTWVKSNPRAPEGFDVPWRPYATR